MDFVALVALSILCISAIAMFGLKTRSITILEYNEMNEGTKSQPYKKLSELLKKGKVGKMIKIRMSNRASQYYLFYERSEKRLSINFTTRGDDHAEMWRNVSEDAINAAAQSEFSGLNPTQTLKEYDAKLDEKETG